MKGIKLNHNNLNGGKETTLACYLPQSEIQAQLGEVLDQEHYKFAKKKGGVILDIGANIGLTSLYLKDSAKKIYAVEPNEINFECLKHNTKDCDNIEIFNFAIERWNGTADLLKTEQDSLAQTLYAAEAWSKQLTKTVTLDKFMKDNKIKHVDVMKIDVEGGEYSIFPSDGFAKVADKIDSIIGEGHYILGAGFAEIIPEILKDYGFKTKFVNFDPPNVTRTFTYSAAADGKPKIYTIGSNTIFIAERP